jgi:hypothetical protein
VVGSLDQGKTSFPLCLQRGTAFVAREGLVDKADTAKSDRKASAM